MEKWSYIERKLEIFVSMYPSKRTEKDIEWGQREIEF